MKSQRVLGYATAVLLLGGGIVLAGPVGPAAAASCTGVASDFNGDGVPDVAIGEPIAVSSSTGGFHVLYGTRSGLTATSPQDQLFQTSDVTDMGTTMAAGDFNGDGCADLADADENLDIGGKFSVGEVRLYQGSPSGLANIDEELTAADGGGTNATNTRFGSALAVGDLNGDGYADLVVGAFEFDAIYVFAGGPLGLTGGVRYVEGVAGVPGNSTGQNEFGDALAVGDFDGDGHDDVAIGAPGENAMAGAVVVLRGGTSTGAPLTTVGAQLFSQDTSGVPGTAEAGDEFGAALATGDFKGNGRTDLAIGVPDEALGTTTLAGTVDVLYSSGTLGSGGLSGVGAQGWSQDSTNVPGTAETDDQFGKALAAGDFNGNGRDDLAVGSPGESVGDQDFAGAVNVLPGSSSGLTGSGSTLWNQNTSGISGTAETDDDFGASLLAVRVRSASRDDLVIGAPGETLSMLPGAGMIHFVPGSSHGLTATGSQAWNDDTSGVKGTTCDLCSFGRSLA